MKKILTVLICLFVLSGVCYAADSIFWVDPNYSGSTRNGGQTTPWRDTEVNWTTIQNALNSGNVTVYFSCANYAGNAEKTSTTRIDIRRGTGTKYRLTIDGNSYFNNSQAAPASWSPNPGSYRYFITASDFVITMENSPYPGTPALVRSKITIKGFHVKATNQFGRGIFIFGINDGIVTQNYVDACSVYHVYSCRDSDTSKWTGPLSGFTFSYNTVVGPTGNEGVYLGGQDNTLGCRDVWQDDWIIEHNNISGATNGDGNGDGLDLKAGKRNLIVRYNTVHDNEVDGIVSHSGGTYYGNVTYGNNGYGAFRVSGYREGTPWGVRPSDVMMYNNIVYDNNTSYGIVLATDSGDRLGTVSLYNNSVRNGTGTNIRVDDAVTLNLQNNATSSGSTQMVVSNVDSVNGGYNNFYGSISGYSRTTGDLNVDPLFKSSTDLNLSPESPNINAGTTIDTFSIDIIRTSRPRGPEWDIGAYEYTIMPPRNFQLIEVE